MVQLTIWRLDGSTCTKDDIALSKIWRQHFVKNVIFTLFFYWIVAESTFGLTLLIFPTVIFYLCFTYFTYVLTYVYLCLTLCFSYFTYVLTYVNLCLTYASTRHMKLTCILLLLLLISWNLAKSMFGLTLPLFPTVIFYLCFNLC